MKHIGLGLAFAGVLRPALRRIVDAWKRDRHRPGFHVQFVVVSIDDDATVTDGDVVRLRHRNTPLGIAKNVGKAYLTRLARDRLESCRYRDVTYHRISPNPHPGATAATGWEVSETVRTQDLGEALRRNAGKIEKLRRILKGQERSQECPS